MKYTSFLASLLSSYFKWRYHQIQIEVLGPEHCKAASEILSQEFCRREPLCRYLGIHLDDIRPFFLQLVSEVAKGGLGTVALGPGRELMGVVTIEDHFDRMEPQGLTHDGLNKIGAYLDSIKIPEKFAPQSRGQIFHGGLAAVSSKNRHPFLLAIMTVDLFQRLKKRGYLGGYAKVTNAVIANRFHRWERWARRDVFRCLSVTKPAEFSLDGDCPFRDFQGETYLFSFKLSV